MELSASMTTRLFPRHSFLSLVLFLTASFTFGLDLKEYARSLEAEGDWYRAIGIWKEIRFANPAGAAYWEAEQAILVDLWVAKQNDVGLREVSRIENSLDSEPLYRRQAGLSWKGLFQYELSRFPSAEYSWSVAQTPLYLGLVEAKSNRNEEAKEHWAGLQSLPDPTTLKTDSRSPVLAASLSLAFPGAGQVYAGHWYDGAQALTLVGFFGFSTWGTYLYDTRVSGNYTFTAISAGISLFFEIANVYGAYKTAEFYNQNQEGKRTSMLENAVFSKPLPSLVTD